jgi:hypothetical protein
MIGFRGDRKVFAVIVHFLKHEDGAGNAFG